MGLTREKIFSYLREYGLEVFFFIAGFLLTHGSFGILEANNVKIPFFAQFIVEITIGTLFAFGGRYFEKKQKSLEQLAYEVKSNVEEYNQTLQRAILSDQITQHYLRIAGWNYNKEVKQYIAKVDHNDSLLGLANEIGQKLYDNVSQKDDWYIVLYNLLLDERTSLSNCSFSMLLETYLRVYIEFMEMYTARAIQNNKKFVIYSFTNAIPRDWFKGGETGNIMKWFLEEKVKRIDKMKQLSYRMVMTTLTTNNKELHEFRLRNYREVNKDWLETAQPRKEQYLDRLHTDRDSALVAIIDIKNLRFYQDLTEFIYFGLIDKDKEEKIENIEWQVCIGGGFSSKYQFLLARFDMFSDQSEVPNVINIKNEAELQLEDSLSPPDNIIVPLDKFPRFIFDKKFNGDSVKIVKYQNIVTKHSHQHSQRRRSIKTS